jgi:hypothetical protein
LALLMIPRHPYAFDDALAEKSVLNFAREHHLQFGKDLVFSYGPWGFLISRYFFPGGQGIQLLAIGWLCFTVALGVHLIARRLPWVSKSILWIVFLFLTCNLDLRADLLFYIGLFSWAMLSLVLDRWKLYFSLLLLAATCAFGILVKGNFLVIGGLSCVAVMADLVWRKQWKGVVFLPFALALIFVLGWVLSGQSLENIRSFFASIAWVVNGYDQTVGIEGLSTLKTRAMLSLLFALAFILMRSLSLAISRPRSVVVAVWCCLITWLIWKHSFVRADFFHMGFFFGFAPLLPFVLALLPALDTPLKRWDRLVGGLCCLFPIYTLQILSFPEPVVSLTMPFRVAAKNLNDLVHPKNYSASRLKEFNAAKADAALPHISRRVGTETIDVFGQSQTYGVFNDLNYHPRPVFQSYEAYNRRLMELNEQFYLSPAAPAFVLFRLEPIDHKFPPLEDAYVLRDLLCNYAPIEDEKNFLLLRRRSDQRPALTLLQAGEVPWDGQISLGRSATTNLWLEIFVEPTIQGRARQILYKAPKPRIKVWLAGRDKALAYPAPAPMLAAGFLASPLLLDNQDLKKFQESGEATRPTSYGVEIREEDAGCWRAPIKFRVYRIEFRNP